MYAKIQNKTTKKTGVGLLVHSTTAHTCLKWHGRVAIVSRNAERWHGRVKSDTSQQLNFILALFLIYSLRSSVLGIWLVLAKLTKRTFILKWNHSIFLSREKYMHTTSPKVVQNGLKFTKDIKITRCIHVTKGDYNNAKWSNRDKKD